MGPPAIGAFVRSERNWQNVSRQEERKSAGLKPVSLGHRMDKLHPGLKFVKGEKNRTGNNECEKNQCVENGYQDAPFAHGSSRLWQSVYHRMTWRGVKGRGRRGSRRAKGFRNWAQKEGGTIFWVGGVPYVRGERGSSTCASRLIRWRPA